jgi:hypothetical protein
VLVGRRVIAPTHVPVVPLTGGKSLERAIALAHDDSTCGHEPVQPPPAPTLGAATCASSKRSLAALASGTRRGSGRSSVHGGGSVHGSGRRTFRESLAGSFGWRGSRHSAARERAATEDLTPSARRDTVKIQGSDLVAAPGGRAAPELTQSASMGGEGGSYMPPPRAGTGAASAGFEDSAHYFEGSGSGRSRNNFTHEGSGSGRSRSNFRPLQRVPSDADVPLSARLRETQQRSQALSAQLHLPSGSGTSGDINAAPVLQRPPGREPSWPPCTLPPLKEMSQAERKLMLESVGANAIISQLGMGSSELRNSTVLSEHDHETAEGAGQLRGGSFTRQGPPRSGGGGGHERLLAVDEGDQQESPAHAAFAPGQHYNGSGHGSTSTAASHVDIVPDGMKAAGGHHAALYAAAVPTSSDSVPAAAPHARTVPLLRGAVGGAAGGAYVPPAPHATQPAPMPAPLERGDLAGAASLGNILAPPASDLGSRMRSFPIHDTTEDAGPVAEGANGESDDAAIASIAGPHAQRGPAQRAVTPAAASQDNGSLDANGAVHDAYDMSPPSSRNIFNPKTADSARDGPNGPRAGAQPAASPQPVRIGPHGFIMAAAPQPTQAPPAPLGPPRPVVIGPDGTIGPPAPSGATARPPRPQSKPRAPQPLMIGPDGSIAAPPEPAPRDRGAAAQERPQAPRASSSTAQSVEALLAGVPAAHSAQSPAAQVAATLRESLRQQEPAPVSQEPAHLSMSDVRCFCFMSTLQVA